jgi:predicted enzyme related to lactoylglutathione lyase
VITMNNAVVHWEIAGRDLGALRNFYAKAFGWTVDDAGEGYCLVQPVAGGIGGGLMQTQDRMPPYVTVYIEVGDLQAALDTVAGLGATPMVPPTRINDSMSFALFQAPEGNTVGLLTDDTHRA